MKSILGDAVEHILSVENPHDLQVIANCHPPDYVNPMPEGRYNLISIGGGTAGLVSSIGASILGARSALIERTLTGGDCLNTGCVPSKALIRASRAAYELRRAAEFGIYPGPEARICFTEAMERMRRLRARISSADSVERLRGEFNVDLYLGEAKFVGPAAIEVAGRRLEFSRAVIATGGRPAELPIPGLKDAGYYTNENVFTLTELPSRMAVIGGGPVGCELGQALLRFGSEITIINDAAQLLPREEPDAAQLIQRQFEHEGMKVVNRAHILRIERRGPDKVILYSLDGKEQSLVCDAILLAAGRVPNIEELNLESAGVEYSDAGVTVDDYLRTSNPRIYAAGDICSKYKFTHAADAMARMVLRNALFFGRNRMGALVIPWVIYTDPEVAHVGYSENDARRGDFEVATITEHLSDVDRAILDGEEEGFARVHYDRRTGRILGGTIVARHAGEMIGELTLAITNRLKMGALSRTIRPYPTQAEVLGKIGDQYNRGRLTPALRRIFRRWFEWRR